MSEKAKVVTRFAPSPTGFLHLGTYRTAIFSYLYAKKNAGQFILRIEDTDKERNKKEFEDNILESLEWMGLKYDQFYRQSENVETHKKYLEKMIEGGHAYISKEEAKDGSGVIKEIVRFKNPNVDITFTDLIKGEVTINTKDLGDFVLAKNLNEPLFHLAVVADDFDEGVTHVIRGEDHVSNTPRQILIQRAIGAPTPTYAHLPLVLGPDKLKLSKRRGALPITEYRRQGYLPEAILNGVAFVGWNPGTEKEIFTHDELVESFDLERVQKSPAVFNEIKLEWFNKEHMKKLSKEEIEKEIFARLPDTLHLQGIIPIIFDRISKWSDVDTMIQNAEIDFFAKEPSIDSSKLSYKDIEISETKKSLESVIQNLEEISDSNFTVENIKLSIMRIADSVPSRGAVLHPVRYALTGLDKSPDPFTVASILGKNETIKRLQKAVTL